MDKRIASIAKVSLCAAVIACSLPWLPTARAAQTARTQPQPRVFAPHCATRPRCAANVCARMGRCSVGKNLVPAGCLIYVCTRGH